MYSFKCVTHSRISQDLLDKIISIKSISWPYSYDDQMRWINQNLHSSDKHLLLMKDETILAYMNLVDIMLSFDSIDTSAYGVGNVCSREKGKGYGTKIMSYSNAFLLEQNLPGLLLCKENLIPFYESCDWRIIDKNKILLDFDLKLSVIMGFNIPPNIDLIKYSGNLF